ncbi:MAG: SH3 domain-containing protein [bacterium]
MTMNICCNRSRSLHDISCYFSSKGAICLLIVALSILNLLPINVVAKELTLSQLIQQMRGLVPEKDIHYFSNTSKRNLQIWRVQGDAIKVAHLPSHASCIKVFSCKAKGYCLLEYRGVLGIIHHQSIKKQAKGRAIYWADKNCKAKVIKKQQNYAQITGVASNDHLNIREKAHYKSKKLGHIPYNGHCVRKIHCQVKWCKITYKGIKGWVNKRYLSKETTACH